MGSSSSRQITAQDRAILDLKLQRDKLKQYQKKIGTVSLREREIAKECLARGDKTRALLALRRRKYQESLLSKTEGQLETLERLTQEIEFTLVEKRILDGLRQGNAVLKQIQKEMSLDSVEKLMEETAEAVQYQREVSEMLAGNLSTTDETEVDEELAAMELEAKGAEEASKKRLSGRVNAEKPKVGAEKVGARPDEMPAAPRTEPSTSEARRSREKEQVRAATQEPQPMLA